MNWQERAEKAEDALRSLASFVGAGGYNADKVDADVFEQKIRWGIGQIMERLEKAEAELAMLEKQEPVTYVIDFNGYAINGKHTEIADALPTGMDLYAAPVPAVAAPVVPEDYRQALVEIALRCTDHDATDAIDALLQSAPQSGSEPVAHHPV